MKLFSSTTAAAALVMLSLLSTSATAQVSTTTFSTKISANACTTKNASAAQYMARSIYGVRNKHRQPIDLVCPVHFSDPTGAIGLACVNNTDDYIVGANVEFIFPSNASAALIRSAVVWVAVAGSDYNQRRIRGARPTVPEVTSPVRFERFASAFISCDDISFSPQFITLQVRLPAGVEFYGTYVYFVPD